MGVDELEASQQEVLPKSLLKSKRYLEGWSKQTKFYFSAWYSEKYFRRHL